MKEWKDGSVENQKETVTRKELIGTLVVLLVSALLVGILLGMVYLVGTDEIAAGAEKFIYGAIGECPDFNGDGKIGDFYPGVDVDDDAAYIGPSVQQYLDIE